MTTNIKINNLIDKLQACIVEKKAISNPFNIIDHFQQEVNDDAVDMLLQKFSDTADFKQLNILSYTLSKYKDESSKESIQKFLLNSELNDYKRNRLILVLQEHPLFDFEQFVEIYPQKMKLVNYTVRNIVNQLEDNGANIDDILASLDLPDDVYFCKHLIDNLCYIYKKKSIWLLSYFAEFPQSEIANYAISALTKQNSIWAQKAIKNLVMSPEERNKILIEKNDESKTKDEIKSCYLSWLDSYGNRMIVFCSSDQIHAFVIHQKNGLLRCTILDNLSHFEQQDIIASWQKNIGIQDVEKEKAVTLLENALWQNKETNNSLPASFGLRSILSGTELTVQQHSINIEKTNLGQIQSEMFKLVRNSGYLAKEFPFNQWWINSEDCRNYVLQNVGNEKNIKYDTLQSFIAQVWENNRANLTDKFLITADFMEMISSQNYKKQIETSVALYLCLKEQKKPLLEIPFVRQLALTNIRKIQETRGYDEK